MTVRAIIRYPDPRLARPAQPVFAFDGALRDLATDLLETMHAAPGIGLRAVCHQHEIDQLNGMFWIRRLSRLKRERLIKKFEKMSER